MTEDQPKTKKDRTPAQKANDERNRARFKALWEARKGSETKVSETPSKTSRSHSETPSKPKTEVSETSSSQSRKVSETASSTSHPSLPPPKEERKEAPAPPKRKPLRLLW